VAVTLYAVLVFSRSEACIGWLKEWLWQPVEFYSYSALTTAAQTHVMNLSAGFHTSKDANEIFMAVWKGQGTINLVRTVCFQVIPMFIDLSLVFGYLYYLFGPYMALNLAMITLVYLYITSKLNTIANNSRREYWGYYVKEWKALQSSISNWQIASVSP
jgi:ABC-type transport system involved in Fe-S cluster assembly fused permease/ATPase subunit